MSAAPRVSGRAGVRPTEEPRSRAAARQRARFALCSVLAAAPLLAFALLLVWRQGAELGDRDAAALRQHAEAGASAVGQRFERAVAVLQAVAASPAARAGDIEPLYAHARRVMEAHPDAAAIGLTRRDGGLVFTTAQPLGTPLPVSRGAAHEQAVFDEGRTVVTPVFRNAISQRLVVAVSVPMRLEGRVAYALRMTLPAPALDAQLRGHAWPAGWDATLIDPQGTVAASLADGLHAVGAPAPAPLREAIARAADGPPAPDDDEAASIRLVAVAGTGYHVAATRPLPAWPEPWRGVATLAVAGAGCLLLGAAVAAALARGSGRDDEPRPRTAARRPERPPGPAPRRADPEPGDFDLAQALGDGSTDPLTGLPGREAFREQALALAQRVTDDPARRLAIMYIDLDGFRAINERFGHDAGDEALQAAARAIRDVVRGEDVAARFGGDEFVICMDCQKAALQATCRAIATRLIDQVAHLGRGLGCSIGIAVSNESRAQLDALVSTAEAAMQMAKRSGTNTFQVVGQ